MELVDKNSELAKRIDAQYSLSAEIRAPFLEQAIAIDRLVADIISQHFCPNEEKRNLFFSLITNGTTITFSASINMLKTLLKVCYPDLDDKHSELIRELEKIRDFRNRIAHSMLDTSDEYLEKGYTDRIRLVFHRDGEQKHQIITKDEIRKRLAACTKVVYALIDIQKEVIARVSVNKQQ